MAGGDQRMPGPITKGLDLKGCLHSKLLTNISFIGSYSEWPGHNQPKTTGDDHPHHGSVLVLETARLLLGIAVKEPLQHYNWKMNVYLMH